jgi:hypothetical protein
MLSTHSIVAPGSLLPKRTQLEAKRVMSYDDDQVDARFLADLGKFQRQVKAMLRASAPWDVVERAELLSRLRELTQRGAELGFGAAVLADLQAIEQMLLGSRPS